MTAAQMDFTPRPSAAFSGAFAELIDGAIKRAREAADAEYRASSETTARPGLGAGRLGKECLRAIAYEYHRTPKDEDRGFSGQLYRIFDRGHMHEAKMVEYLRLAGFTVIDKTKDGGQFRYDIARYEDTGKGRVKGFGDAVVTAGPTELVMGGLTFPLRYPLLWENKELGSKAWKKLDKGGLRAYGGDYFPQVQMGMFHLGLADNPALFTAKNADTQEIYAELVALDPAFVQSCIDKVVKIIDAPEAEFLPRIATKSTDYRCKFCDFAARCWRQEEPSAAPEAWGGFGTRD